MTANTETGIMDKMCTDRCKSTCEINQQLSFKIQTPQNFGNHQSPNFAFLPNYTDPDLSSFKSYSGDLLLQDKDGWRYQSYDGKQIYRVNMTGFPLGIQSWTPTHSGIFFMNIFCQKLQILQCFISF